MSTPTDNSDNPKPEKKQYHYNCHNCGKESEETRDEPFLGIIFCPKCKTKKHDPPKKGATTQELLEVFCHEFGIPGKPTFKGAMGFIKNEIGNLKKELAVEKEDHAHTAESTDETFSRGLDLIVAERLRQIEEEGCDDENDDGYEEEELLKAALCYAENGLPDDYETHWEWPWIKDWDKRGKHDQLRSLAISGALIAAEIDRLFRKKEYEEERVRVLCQDILHPRWPDGSFVTQEEFIELRKKFAKLGRRISCGEEDQTSEVDLYPKWPNGTPATQEDFDNLRREVDSYPKPDQPLKETLVLLGKQKDSISELRGALTALRDAHKIRYGSTIFEITSRDGIENYNIHELCKTDPDEKVEVSPGSEQAMVTNDYQASSHATPLEKAIEMHERHKDELRTQEQGYSPLVHTLDLIFEHLRKKDHGVKVCTPSSVAIEAGGEE